MSGMKITVDAAMRARDVSRPSPADELAEETASPAPTEEQANGEQPKRPPRQAQARQPRAGQTAGRQAAGRPGPHRDARLPGGQPI